MQLIVFLFGLYSLASFTAEYTLADLEVLSQEGNYTEFFQHALDVRPTERQELWNKMVLKMSEKMLQDLLKKNEIKKSDFQMVEKISTWPTLKSDEFFLQRRQDFSLKYLENCLKKAPACIGDLNLFWEHGPHNADTAIKLAEFAFQYKELNLNPWNYLSLALKSNLSEFYCRKPFVLDEIWKKFDSIVLQQKSDIKILKSIDNTVHPECLKSFNPFVKNKLLTPQGPTERETAFIILRSQGKINSKDEDFFYSVYLLERPSQGDLFNEAWNRIKDLGRQVEKRESVISQLKKLDPIPDEIFGSMDQLKRKVVLKHLKLHFPEFFNFYIQQCFAYYSGKGQFPNGNPTLNCQKIMESDVAPELFTADQMKTYKALHSI